FKFIAQAVLAGYYEKNIVGTTNDRTGYEFLVGLSSGFEWDQKRSAPIGFEESPDSKKDFWARAHLIGSTLRATGFYKGIRFDLEMRLHADYVMVSSYALEQFENAQGSRDG